MKDAIGAGAVLWQFTWVAMFIYALNTTWGIVGRDLSLRDALLDPGATVAVPIALASVAMMFYRRRRRRELDGER
jgi:hypothetical protein